MLADLIAATALPTSVPADVHNTYDWWSDIWLPALTGLGSIAVAVVAIGVARRSNRLARAATRAAERSNAIAKRALAHDEARAREEDRKAGQAEREIFSARAVAVLDELADLLEQGDKEAALRAYDKMSLLQFESISRGYADVPTARGVNWITDVAVDHGKISRPDAFQKARQVYHAALAAWATNPDQNLATSVVLDRILREQLAGKELRDIEIP